MFPSAVLLFLVAISLVSSGVGDPTIQDAPDGLIVGGDKIALREAPYQAAILLLGGLHCGGTLLSMRIVITAAHCWLSSASLPKVQVRAGSISSFQHGTVRNVTKFVRHPNYDSNNMDNDVALVKVDESFVWKMYVIQPLPINQLFNPPPGEEVIVTGWGHMEDGGSRPIELRYVMLPTISLKECKRYYRFFKQTPTENMFCTYAPGNDACQGDSGGPAVHDSELVGIVSWGRGCAKEGSPGVFTNLSSSAVYDFVNRQMEIL